MYSYNEFERLFLRYKLEGVPNGISIEQFCLSNKVPYNLFEKWYKDTRKKIIPVQVLGTPPAEVDSVEISASILNQNPTSDSLVLPHTELRILVDIRMSNGVHVSQKNLSYEGLKNLVGKLEDLC
ncbi:MAG: hypothetical protein ACLS4S_09175 [Bacteroides nordii]